MADTWHALARIAGRAEALQPACPSPLCSGAMVGRWVAFGILEAEKGLRKLRGYKSMHWLVAALRKLDQQDRVDAAGVAA